MTSVARTILVLLVAAAAVAASALNGRVLCVGGADHVAVEARHADGGGALPRCGDGCHPGEPA
ncbi:MAG: hypothetical protein JWO31_2929, partial [Phycisphaerales bacterium]|nr:hypothetical protein [Phycisphaerales bacterium]